MRSTSKSVLACKATVGGKPKTHLVAVFPNDAKARQYATVLYHAIISGDLVTAKQLDAGAVTDGNGMLVTDVRFSLLGLPYDPVAAAASADIFEGESKPTE